MILLGQTWFKYNHIEMYSQNTAFYFYVINSTYLPNLELAKVAESRSHI